MLKQLALATLLDLSILLLLWCVMDPTLPAYFNPLSPWCVMDPTLPAYFNPLSPGGAPAVGGWQDQQQGEQQASLVPAVGGGGQEEAQQQAAGQEEAQQQAAQQESAAAAQQAPGPAIGDFVWNPDWSREEIAHFRTLPAWNTLRTWVQQNLRVFARRTSAAHTTNACQPGKVPGPSGPNGSLKSCGLETFLQVPAVGGGSMSYVQVCLPHAFVHGDGLEIRFVSLASVELDTHMKIQEHACTELLCYLVVSAPARVRLHPSCFRGGTQGIEEFQTKAVDFGRSVGFNTNSLAWQVPEIHAGQPLAASACIGQALAAAPPPVGPAAGPAVGGIDDHVAILTALQGLKINKEYLTLRDRIPTDIAMQLKDLLPKDGLLPFLKQYPNFFEVTISGQVNRKKKPMYTFTVKPSIKDLVTAYGGGASPAVGGQGPTVGDQGPSPVGPAVGGQGGSSSSGGPQPSNTVATLPLGLEPVGSNVSSSPTWQDVSSLSTWHSAAPAVGGLANIPEGTATQWSVQDMVAYLDALYLGHLGPAIIANGLDGHFFLQCTQAELELIGIGFLQWKKIMTYMPQ